MELESAFVVTKFAFSERIVVIEIVVKRLADQILQVMLGAMYKILLGNLLDNVSDAVLPH